MYRVIYRDYEEGPPFEFSVHRILQKAKKTMEIVSADPYWRDYFFSIERKDAGGEWKPYKPDAELSCTEHLKRHGKPCEGIQGGCNQCPPPRPICPDDPPAILDSWPPRDELGRAIGG